jgi:hypothetical protein
MVPCKNCVCTNWPWRPAANLQPNLIPWSEVPLTLSFHVLLWSSGAWLYLQLSIPIFGPWKNLAHLTLWASNIWHPFPPVSPTGLRPAHPHTPAFHKSPYPPFPRPRYSRNENNAILLKFYFIICATTVYDTLCPGLIKRYTTPVSLNFFGI